MRYAVPTPRASSVFRRLSPPPTETTGSGTGSPAMTVCRTHSALHTQSRASDMSSRCARVYASCLASITCSRRSAPARAPRSGHATEGVHAQVVSAHAVPNDHVERCRRRPSFIKASHIEPLGSGPPVDELMDRPLVPAECEHHQRVAPEEVDEGRLVHAVEMGLGLEQGHEVHDVDHPHLQFRHAAWCANRGARRSAALRNTGSPTTMCGCRGSTAVGLTRRPHRWRPPTARANPVFSAGTPQRSMRLGHGTDVLSGL